ncbi:MAG TPA: carboxypeptidase regulatory-like domain-containing protein, partial [Gemmatimonadales bacterium]|nr:carboxypeptidase regulatory-like domain-containing protein [Gemmatimonadales bacterium]
MNATGTAVAVVTALILAAVPTRILAQAEGAIAGRVLDASSKEGLSGAQILVDGRLRAIADTTGIYRARNVRSGWHRVSARLIGYRSVVWDSVFVSGGATITLDFALETNPLELAPLVVTAPVDPVLDPMATATEQKISAEDLRALPVSSLEEALALSAGSVGTSYRGGRLGEESFILDGLGVKNQLDAATGGLGIRIPPDVLSEASLVTNGFSARYGQALSGLVNVVTREPDAQWEGRLGYETDRPFGGSWDLGLDRFVAQADGPVIGRIGAVAAIDVAGRLDADPVNAPPPTDPRDPRTASPALLPHNSGEQWSGLGKVTLPLTTQLTVRLLGLHSEDQNLLYDPAYKYDLHLAPAQRLRGDLLTGHVQYASAPGQGRPLIVDVRVGRFSREFLRGTLSGEVDYAFGGITGRRFHFVGEDVARAQQASPAPIPGLHAPEPSIATPWGVPAFFMGGGSGGELSWSRFGETRGRLDVTFGASERVDIYAGAELTRQQVRTFQRALGYLPAGDSVPPPAASAFSPRSAAGYIEAQIRLADLALTGGLRYDQFNAGSGVASESRGSQRRLSPRFAVSTVLVGATFVASYGRFTQAPDYQYLVDAAFDDTTRTGRFRRGNPNIGFEDANQYEFSLRVRPTPVTSLRLGVYVKRLYGLVASVPLGIDPDSTIFGNADAGSVKGAELLFEREMLGGFEFRLAYTLQSAVATATDGFLLNRLVSIDPVTGDTIRPARAEFPLDYDRRHSATAVVRGRVPDDAGPRLLGARLLGGLETAAILRYSSGLPFSRTNSAGDSLIGLPNDSRLPATTTVDLIVRRPVRIGGTRGGVYLDIRNLLNRRNIVAVRRDTGMPGPTAGGVDSLAEAAYQANPGEIPYESARYRAFADTDGNGYIEGRE